MTGWLGGRDIRVGEVIALEQQGRAPFARQGIGKTIPKVQAGFVTAALAETAKGVKGNVGLKSRDGFDLDVQTEQQAVKKLQKSRIATIKNHSRFQQVGRAQDKAIGIVKLSNK